MSYEATKKGRVPIAARVRRGTTPASCITSRVQRWRHCGSQPNNATIPKPLVHNLFPTQPPFYMVRHFTYWVAPFPSSFLQIPPYSAPSPLLLPRWTRDGGNRQRFKPGATLNSYILSVYILHLLPIYNISVNLIGNASSLP